MRCWNCAQDSNGWYLVVLSQYEAVPGGKDTMNCPEKAMKISHFNPNQSAPSIYIMKELCYFSLDQWEIRLHLFCDPHLNQTKFNDLLPFTIHGVLDGVDHVNHAYQWGSPPRPSWPSTTPNHPNHSDYPDPWLPGSSWPIWSLWSPTQPSRPPNILTTLTTLTILITLTNRPPQPGKKNWQKSCTKQQFAKSFHV